MYIHQISKRHHPEIDLDHFKNDVFSANLVKSLRLRIAPTCWCPGEFGTARRITGSPDSDAFTRLRGVFQHLLPRFLLYGPAPPHCPASALRRCSRTSSLSRLCCCCSWLSDLPGVPNGTRLELHEHFHRSRLKLQMFGTDFWIQLLLLSVQTGSQTKKAPPKTAQAAVAPLLRDV